MTGSHLHPPVLAKRCVSVTFGPLDVMLARLKSIQHLCHAGLVFNLRLAPRERA
jgi:hypothetical protein